VFVALGLGLSVVFVRETAGHAKYEAAARRGTVTPSTTPSARDVFALVSWRHPALFNVSQAGLINNLNDGLAWGLFPLFFASAGLSLREIGVLAFVYPAAWGVVQLWTGALSDRIGRKWLIAAGLVLQGIALVGISLTSGFSPWLVAGAVLGVGTAMVYPTLLAAIGDVAHPLWRGSAVGVYRLWRDLGYALGALLAGIVADAFGIAVAIAAVGMLTAASGLLVATRMPETLPLRSPRAIAREAAT
jgi:MFS family permease